MPCKPLSTTTNFEDTPAAKYKVVDGENKDYLKEEVKEPIA